MFEEKEFNKITGDAIRRLKTNKKYSSEKLAELSSTDYSSISLIENGKQNPKSYTLYKILLALDVDILQSFNTKSKERHTLENSVIEKIKVLDSPNLQAVFELLDNFKIVKR